MKSSPKNNVLQFLKENSGKFFSGAWLEDQQWGGKRSATGRALRRLYTEGKLNREYRKLANRNDEQVWYQYSPQPTSYALPKDFGLVKSLGMKPLKLF